MGRNRIHDEKFLLLWWKCDYFCPMTGYLFLSKITIENGKELIQPYATWKDCQQNLVPSTNMKVPLAQLPYVIILPRKHPGTFTLVSYISQHPLRITDIVKIPFKTECGRRCNSENRWFTRYCYFGTCKSTVHLYLIIYTKVFGNNCFEEFIIVGKWIQNSKYYSFEIGLIVFVTYTMGLWVGFGYMSWNLRCLSRLKFCVGFHGYMVAQLI